MASFSSFGSSEPFGPSYSSPNQYETQVKEYRTLFQTPQASFALLAKKIEEWTDSCNRYEENPVSKETLLQLLGIEALNTASAAEKTAQYVIQRLAQLINRADSHATSRTDVFAILKGKGERLTKEQEESLSMLQASITPLRALKIDMEQQHLSFRVALDKGRGVLTSLYQKVLNQGEHVILEDMHRECQLQVSEQEEHKKKG